MMKTQVLPKPPFRFLFVARSQQGKTTLLVKLLYNYWVKQFSKIYIFCPTYKTDRVWSVIDEFVKNKKVIVFTNFSLKKVKKIHENCVKAVQKDSNFHTLVIFDDCSGRAGYKVDGDKGYLNLLACSGNHANLSQIHCIQKVTQVTKTMRLQTEGLITFYIQNQEEIKALHSEFGVGRLKLFQKLLHHCTEKPYHFLYIKMQGPGPNNYFHNFDLINTKKYLEDGE